MVRLDAAAVESALSAVPEPAPAAVGIRDTPVTLGVGEPAAGR